MTRHPFSFVVVALGLAACGAGTNGREAAVTAPVSSTASVSAGDRAWLAATHESDQAEIEYGRLAERKGATAAVRNAGSMLAADHGAFDAKVVRVADGLGIELPSARRSRQAAVAQRLEKMSGSRFDREFTATVTEEHRKAIAAAEGEVRHGGSPDVIALARAALPDLRRHLDMVRKAGPVA